MTVLSTLSKKTFTILPNSLYDIQQLKKKQKYFYMVRIKHSRESAVGIALGYGVDDRGSKVRFPVGVRNFSLHHCVQNGSGAHPASYPMGTRVSFPGGKAAGA
jgi:hypothetical protein